MCCTAVAVDGNDVLMKDTVTVIFHTCLEEKSHSAEIPGMTQKKYQERIVKKAIHEVKNENK